MLVATNLDLELHQLVLRVYIYIHIYRYIDIYIFSIIYDIVFQKKVTCVVSHSLLVDPGGGVTASAGGQVRQDRTWHYFQDVFRCVY